MISTKKLLYKVVQKIGSVESDMWSMVYPVGSYYETSDASFDPNVTWGGTWSLETAGKVHIGAGTGYTLGDTGGEATHKLTKAESGLPSHAHGFTNPTVTGSQAVYGAAEGASGNSKYVLKASVTSDNFARTGTYTASGGAVQTNSGADASSAHNNMPPYIVVNRWHRTA